jgi:hypothetical protein
MPVASMRGAGTSKVTESREEERCKGLPGRGGESERRETEPESFGLVLSIAVAELTRAVG